MSQFLTAIGIKDMTQYHLITSGPLTDAGKLHTIGQPSGEYHQFQFSNGKVIEGYVRCYYNVRHDFIYVDIGKYYTCLPVSSASIILPTDLRYWDKLDSPVSHQQVQDPPTTLAQALEKFVIQKLEAGEEFPQQAFAALQALKRGN